MKNYEELFMESKGRPIIVNGEQLYSTDKIPVKHDFSIALRILSVDSEYPQIIELSAGRNGSLLYNNQTEPKLSILADTTPLNQDITISGTTDSGELLVWNAWIMKDHLGNDVKHSWRNCAAMKKEAIGNTIRYSCNDGFPDDDFNDLVFEIRLEP